MNFLKNIMKRVVIAVCLLNFSLALFCKTSERIESAPYVMDVIYNENAFPGDVVVMRLLLSPSDNSSKSISQFTRNKNAGNFCAEMKLFNDEKCVSQTDFFIVPAKFSLHTSISQLSPRQTTKTQEFLAYLPLSTWLKEGKYYLQVILHVTKKSVNKKIIEIENKNAEFVFDVLHKDFVTETIPLNAKNSEIKNNVSDERVSQINNLNKIFATTNKKDVFTTKSFITPVASDSRRSSFFGDRRIFKYANGKSSVGEHFGIDFAVPTGTVVYACGDGKVVMAENRVSTGWSIAVEHAPGLYSLYYHLDNLGVVKGQFVKQGEKLGASGCTGLATGPHLHWEIRLNMYAVSPDFFVNDYAFNNEAM